jgi:mannose-1-phosphate guanylyltransferase/mannose-6-phosphate isomerase
MLYGLIIAGGSGTRLWPLSRSSLPKHLLPLHPSGATLLCDTFARLARTIPAERIFIVTGTAFAEDVLAQVRLVAPEFTKEQLLIEPQGRDSAAAVLWGALHLGAIDPEASAAVVWSDQVVANPAAFDTALLHAVRVAKDGALVAVGIRPRRPDTRLGYIVYAPEAVGGAHRAERFIEKPDLETAERLLAEGRCVWNAGIFVFHVATLLGEFRRLAPELFAAFARHERSGAGSQRWRLPESVQAIYTEAPKGSLDYLVLEKTDRLYVVPAELDWNDVGTWDAVWQEAAKNAEGNSVTGPATLLASRNCLVRADRRLVTVVGATNLAVIDTKDALLVCDLGHAGHVRQLVEELKKQGRKEVHGSEYAVRPWGSYTVLWEGPGFKVKELLINPGQKLSLQMHRHRSEHWVVTNGELLLTRGEEIVRAGPDSYLHVPAGVKHRIENPADEPARLIEVQSGRYVAEDDIVRFEDVYGRV